MPFGLVWPRLYCKAQTNLLAGPWTPTGAESKMIDEPLNEVQKRSQTPTASTLPHYQLRETFNEKRVRIQGRGAAEIRDPFLPRKGGIGDVDLIERFDVVADEGDGDDEDVSAAVFRKARYGLFGRRLQPFHRTCLGLEGQLMLSARKPLHRQAHRLLDLGKVGIAALDEGDGKRMGGKENGCCFFRGKAAESLGNRPGQRLDEQGMVVEALDA